MSTHLCSLVEYDEPFTNHRLKRTLVDPLLPTQEFNPVVQVIDKKDSSLKR